MAEGSSNCQEYNPVKSLHEKKIVVASGAVSLLKCRICFGEHWTGRCYENDNTKEKTAIRITNLSESTRYSDIEILVMEYGPITGMYLGKDRNKNSSTNFACINFKSNIDAIVAINGLDGLCYKNSILSVTWAVNSEEIE